MRRAECMEAVFPQLEQRGHGSHAVRNQAPHLGVGQRAGKGHVDQVDGLGGRQTLMSEQRQHCAVNAAREENAHASRGARERRSSSTTFPLARTPKTWKG